ncbi:MAG: IclR family transcriptional regulator [Alcaligenaceae bacterium]|nr:IclR family transcriptional regulator [Alcaligenaceae bacterium]
MDENVEIKADMPGADIVALGEKPKKLNSVEAVKVAVRIMDELALAHRSMGVTELADALGETKPRVHRHLSTLKEMGLIEQDNQTERYRLGWRVFQLGEAAGTQFDLRSRAEPYLLRVRDTLRETAVLAVPINAQPMVISTADNIYARICISVKPGNRPLPHCSAVGRVTLAFAKSAQQEELLARPLLPETERSLVDKDELRQRLVLIREQMYDVCDSEMLLGVNTVAVPIFRDGDRLAGILAIVGSIQHIPSPPLRQQVEVLQDCAAELSAQLSGTAYEVWKVRKQARQRMAELR